MKKLLTLNFLVLIMITAFAAPFKNLPYTIYQPDGTTIECFVSGDEYFNWIHDAEGYSIKKGKDGYYYYATKLDNNIITSQYVVNSVNPKDVGLSKWTKISRDDYMKRRKLYDIPLDKQKATKAPHVGTLNNIVIYIRFSGEDEISTTREAYDIKLNGETGESLKDYYNEVSYNQLTITSTHYPSNDNPTTTNTSYEDSHERSYFQPYDETLNPEGYDGDTERRQREHRLLVDAVEWVNANAPIPDDLNIDGDNDGYVDNICFMINGVSGEWAELLWAHRWSLWTYDVAINGKEVSDYTFQPENQVSVRTLCHEMFHALGAPDLYHYYEGKNIDPAGEWDIMEHGNGHMGAYMKWKYADKKWVTEIPEIVSGGSYNLNPLTEATNNCYKIMSPYSTNEYFVLEYRKRVGEFESSIPGNGLLVYRINDAFNGNAQYDGQSVFDEVYIYRPGGTPSINGDIDLAHFTNIEGRTEINDESNPSCFLHDSTPGGLSLKNITMVSSTVSFEVEFGFVSDPTDISFEAVSESEINLAWELNRAEDDIILAWSENKDIGDLEESVTYAIGDELTGGGTILTKGDATSFTHADLDFCKVYHYKIWSINSEGKYSEGSDFSAYTQCGEITLPYTQDFSDEALPAGWINIDNQELGIIWEFDNPAERTFNSTSSANGFAILDSENYGSGSTQDADLVSPSFNLTGINGVKISFEHTFKSWVNNSAKLNYSINGGETWQTAKTWSTSSGSTNSPKLYEIFITEGIANQTEVQFAWNYTGEYGYYWMLDDIEITTDSTKPTVEISSEYTDIVRSSPIDFTINFSEEIDDFELNDISIENGVGDSLFSDNNLDYTLIVSPTSPGNVVIKIAENTVTNDYGNGNDSIEYSVEYGWPVSVYDFNNKSIEIYPNPNKGLFTIEGLEENSIVKIFDIAGNEIYFRMFNNNKVQIDISQQSSGCYFIQIVNESNITNSKFIIK
jgi:M6 family metalloprotease-like protein